MRPLLAAGTVLGMGLGAFLDGILLHQLLQFHSMLSAKYPPTSVVNLEINMFWDGVFHAGAWLATAAGIALLWRAVRRDDVLLSTRAFCGALILGWGLFNVVEGIVDHHILHLHHVRETANHLAWDIGFLVFSAGLIATGWLLIRSAKGGRQPEVASDPPMDLR